MTMEEGDGGVFNLSQTCILTGAVVRDVGQRDVCSSPDWTCLYGDGVERVGERRGGPKEG